MSVLPGFIQRKLIAFKTSYLLVPGFFCLTAILFAIIFLSLDRLIVQYNLDEILEPRWLFTTTAAGARSLLTTVSGSMITVTGIIFSITLVSLSMASQQFGPRLLQNFLRDQTNQFVLGLIAATYIYCLLIMRTVKDGTTESFIPNLSVNFALVLAVLSVGALIIFLHHTVHSIQVTRIIETIHDDIMQQIQAIYPPDEKLICSRHSGNIDDYWWGLQTDSKRVCYPIHFTHTGYIETIDLSGLIRFAEKNDAVIRMHKRVGHFLCSESCVATLALPQKPSNEKQFREQFLSNMTIGRKRTPDQDLEFMINELVEIAVRALSPGVNDPFTAINCIDHLGSIHCVLIHQFESTPFYCDSQQQLRLLDYSKDYSDFLGVSFGLIRQNGHQVTPVEIRLLETFNRILKRSECPKQVDALENEAAQLWSRVAKAERAPSDYHSLQSRYETLTQTVRNKRDSLS